MLTLTHGPYEGARKMAPTKKHRRAMWENMLGTVYAENDSGAIRYFDYDYAGARAFAGVDEDDRDPRVAKSPRSGGVQGTCVLPSRGQRVLYVRKH